jgi:hypothetical protein
VTVKVLSGSSVKYSNTTTTTGGSNGTWSVNVGAGERDYSY